MENELKFSFADTSVPQKKFCSLEELKERMKIDISVGKGIF